MDTQFSAGQFPHLNLLTPGFAKTKIAGIECSIFLIDGALLISIREIMFLLGYKNYSAHTIRVLFQRNGHDLSQFTIKSKVKSLADSLLINEEGLRTICKIVKPSRTAGLREWLDAGGMKQAEPIQGKTVDICRFEQPAKAANVYNLGDYAHTKTPDRQDFENRETQQNQREALYESPDGQDFERRKAYCRDLCRILLRHADGVEAETFIRSVEESIARITARRYVPGLNAAAYDMYARHMLKGGVQ